MFPSQRLILQLALCDTDVTTAPLTAWQMWPLSSAEHTASESIPEQLQQLVGTYWHWPLEGNYSRHKSFLSDLKLDLEFAKVSRFS